MPINDTIHRVTERIIARSHDSRRAYLERMRRAADDGPRRAHLSCGNQAHAYAAMGPTRTGSRTRARPMSASSPPITTCSRRTSRSSISPT